MNWIFGIESDLSNYPDLNYFISVSVYVTSRYYKPYLSGSPRDRPSKERQLGKKIV